MNSSAYWSSKIDYYSANHPPKAESFYNQSFVDKMNEAQANIDNLVAEKDKSWAAYNQARDDYNAFSGTISSYGEVYNQSKSEFGIEEHRDNYEKSKKALAMAESTLEALPSSINASSNRVLTQAQREARYNTLADKAMSYRDNLLARSSAYEDVWKKARQEQATYAQAEMAIQYSKLAGYNNTYLDAINDYTNAGKKLTQGKVELLDWQNQYRQWQHRQWNNEHTIWLNNLSSAVTRYCEALDTERAERETALQKEQAEREARWASEERQMKEKHAEMMVNNYLKVQNAKNVGSWYDAGGALGGLLYILGR